MAMQKQDDQHERTFNNYARIQDVVLKTCLSFIASGRSSGLHPISSHSSCMYVLAGRPAFARPYVGVHRISLMSSPLLLQQCLTRIVFVMGGRWPYC